MGTIAAGNDEEVGKMIADAMDKVGKEGVISLEEGKSMTTELEVTWGMRFDKGYISPYFATDTERMEAVLDEPYILLTDKKIGLVQDLVPVLEAIARTGKPLLIIEDAGLKIENAKIEMLGTARRVTINKDTTTI